MLKVKKYGAEFNIPKSSLVKIDAAYDGIIITLFDNTEIRFTMSVSPQIKAIMPIINQTTSDIVVIDMPLLHTRIEGKNLVGKFIADVVLQVLSFVAENERETMKQRQAEGIRMAKLRGVKFGRPSTPTPNDFDNIVRLYKEKKITVITAINMSGLTRGTFYRKLKRIG